MPDNKIAYLISQYPAGSHTFILREILHLRHSNIELHVASINNPDRTPDKLTTEELKESQNTYYIKSQGFTGTVSAFFKTFFTHPLGLLKGIFACFRLAGFNIERILYHFFYLAEALIVGSWMKEKKITHLHIHFGLAVSTVGLFAKEVYPITLSLTIHGPDEFYDVSHYLLSEKINAAKFICCISYFAQSQLMRLSNPALWNKFEVVPLGVQPTASITTNNKNDKKSTHIVSVGRLVPMKGHLILIRAVASLIQKGNDLHLTIVGGGPEKERLTEEIVKLHLTDKIKLTGHLNQPDVNLVYQDADLFVVSSFSEGIPIVLMEAMSRQIACIASNINGIPELIRHEKDGLLVIPSDVNDLEEALSSLIKNPDLRHKLAKAGQERVIDKYNININTENLEKIFNKRLFQEIAS